MNPENILTRLSGVKVSSTLIRLVIFSSFFLLSPIPIRYKTYYLDILVFGFLVSSVLKNKNRPTVKHGMLTIENTVTLLLQMWHVWAIFNGLNFVFAMFLISIFEALYYLGRGITRSVGVKTQMIIGM